MRLYPLLSNSTGESDSKRSELTHILLTGLFLMACLWLAAMIIESRIGPEINEHAALLETALLLAAAILLWRLAKLGQHVAVRYILLICLGAYAVRLMLRWSFSLPGAELAFGLMIAVAGILLTARRALMFSSTAITAWLALSWAQTAHYLSPDTSWLDQSLFLSDAVGYSSVFGVISLVSWLYNREVEHALQQAKDYEAALIKERDSLEIKVRQRTRELETAQLLRTMELQRLADFGRINANLLHEIANPLTAASLNLDQFDGRQIRLVRRARQNLRQLENYLQAARHQLSHQSQPVNFSASKELSRLMRVLEPIANKRQTKLQLDLAADCKLYGDPVKFAQIVTNLATNALDAYEDLADALPERRIVIIKLRSIRHDLHIEVHDQGRGITASQLPRLFEPFYSTKSSQQGHLGLGLAMVKQYVEADFKGTIKVSSRPGHGTVFSLKLKSATGRN